jgi:GntR family transcriptional repressor for pyruvate dehydrogenase complex
MDQKITPIKKTRVSEEVFRQLSEMIRDGYFQPGDPLPNERALSEQFQVSRASVREALRTLQTMGLIESHVGVSGGNFVKQVNVRTLLSPFADFLDNERQTLQEIMEFRLVLETEISRIAASRRNSEDLDRIRESLDAMRDNVEEGGIGLEEDNVFHEDIARATHNEVFVHMLTMARTLLSKSRETTLSIKGVPQTGIRHHTRIFKALEEGNPDKAAEAMHQHLLEAQKNVARG